MIPDRLQHFLDDLWNFQHFPQIWTRAPCIYGVYYTKILQQYQKVYGDILKKLLCLHIWTSKKSQFGKRQAPRNPEDPSNEITKIMDTKSISIKNMNGFLQHVTNIYINT